ncbi:MAG: hypothetical protein ABI835_18450 [Chloroflexota bacterium]
MTKRIRFLFPLLLILGALWVGVPAASAQGETFQVISVDSVGCNSGDFGWTVERANLDGGTYRVHTVVTVAGLVYMNENAGVSINGLTSWNIFNNFSYGPVPNLGTYPIPAGTQMRVDFYLERPLGTVLYAWTNVVDGCDTGNSLFNGLTSVYDAPAVAGAGCTLGVPAGSVVGEAPLGAQVYYEPGNVTNITLNPGTYIVVGQDESENYYKVMLACQFVWVQKNTMQPSYQPPQNGAPLPTTVVS